MRPYLVVCLVLAGCATGPQNPIRESWVPPASDYWANAQDKGVRLRHKDGRVTFIRPQVLRNLVSVNRRLQEASGVTADLALVDTETPNAFATVYKGRPLIALSLSYLEHLGADPDALATTIGHELAHLQLGHGGQARKEREETVQTGRAVGTVMNMIVPFSGTVASMGVTAYARSFSRDEERQADEYGLKWATAAGFDPCGKTRVVAMYSKLGPVNIPFLSTHPGQNERSELANDHSLKANGKACA